MNPPLTNHTTGPRDMGSSSANCNGINLAQRKVLSESKFQRGLHSPVMAEPSTALINHMGHKLPEVFQLKQGSYADLPPAKISEMMKSANLDNAPTQSLLSVVNGILEESVERRNGEVPQRVACLLRKVVQEIERRISTQAEHLRTQNTLFKTREEKYQSRIKVLEALASGIREEISKTERTRTEAKKVDDSIQTEKTIKEEKKIDGSTQVEEKRVDDKEVVRLLKELEEKNMEVSTLKQEQETMKKIYEVKCSKLEAEAKDAKGELKQKSEKHEHLMGNLKEEGKREDDKEVVRLIKELQEKNVEILTLKEEQETMKKALEQCSQKEAEAKDAKEELKQKSPEYEHFMKNLKVENREDGKEVVRLIKELENKNEEILTLKQEQETMKKALEKYSQLEAEAKDVKGELEQKSEECEHFLKKLKDENREDGKEVVRLIKELEEKNEEISTLKQKQEMMKKTYEVKCSQLEAEAKDAKGDLKQKSQEYESLLENLKEKTVDDKEVVRLIKELEDNNVKISNLKQEQETMKKAYELKCSQLEAEAQDAKGELKHKSQEYELKQKSQEEGKDTYDKEISRLITELEGKKVEISNLKREQEAMKKTYEVKCSQLEAEAKDAKGELKQKSQEYELKQKSQEEEKSADDKEVVRLIKELEGKNVEISGLKDELEIMKKAYEVKCSQLEAELKDAKGELEQKSHEQETMKKAYDVKCSRLETEVNDAKEELKQKSQEYELNHKSQEEEKRAYEKDVVRLTKELEDKNMEIATLKQEQETMKNAYEKKCSQIEAEVKDAKEELTNKSQEYEHLMENLRNKVRENEVLYESKYQKWNMKENQIRKVVNFQFCSIQELKLSWESIKQDAMKEQMIYEQEFSRLGVNLKPLVDAAENYQIVLSENRKLFNEIQELKGNIRVYCRVRPFIPGQKEKQTIVEHYGESELVVANPSKQGKEALKTFKFNKVFGPASTQAEVYADIQGFIRSVLDGYNVCIFAYGQTGSGKTYTMSGPNGATSETYGVNYRALEDLFNISISRKSSIVYEIGVQVIEIYNEQVRDLLATDATPKKLGILNHSQPNGLAVPDATMQPVTSTSDVMKLMDIGLKNRAKGSTAMNERSSRSHSVVSIHVRGVDQKSGSTLVGNLHLVDLAGSERIDRSEVVGDRLKEAQHINKSLSALGDVIFALSQKNAHVPYRNSKLTQLLQTSLGGQAKTLMLVQINSDQKSFSESLSTLKFAERVSGVELGAAKSSKDGRDVKDLMEQVASLKDTILTKDEEIERLQLLKDLKNAYPGATADKLEAACE